MKNLLRLAFSFAVLPTFALAVYAPIPEQEQGKALSYRLGTSAYYDSNIFGAATDAIDSMVYNFSATILYNGSIDKQTFASGSYTLSNDYIVDRPTGKNLTSHTLNARLAHAFSSASNIDLTGLYAIAKNPEVLLATGQPINTDQSNKRAQFDARYTTAAGEKMGLVTKYRFINYNYDNASLSNQLDRSEHLAGLELSYALLPETKLVGEYRYQSINYNTGGSLKDKTSNFLMTGVDYNPSKQLLFSSRFGFEDRNRDAGGDTTAPYVELTGRYTYAEGSYFSSGYTYTLEEPSDTVQFIDSRVNRLFVNVEHRLTGAITASGSLTYEPARLKGRSSVGQADIDETTTRFGLGLTWQPDKNWTVAGTYDYDDINSDQPSRGQNRQRIGLSASYTF